MEKLGDSREGELRRMGQGKINPAAQVRLRNAVEEAKRIAPQVIGLLEDQVAKAEGLVVA